MLLSPTTDAAAVNALVNDPSVRPTCGFPELGDLDFTAAIQRPENLFLLGDHGGYMLIWTAPGVREVHVFITPEGRGKWGFASLPEMVSAAAKLNVSLLWARVDPDMPQLEMFARRCGMKPTGEIIETGGVDYRIFSMEVQQCHRLS